MKKIYIFLTMFSLLLCTSCSGKNNNASDYAQNNAQYGTLIDRTRMSMGLNDQRHGNRNYVIQPDGSLWTWGIAVDLYNYPDYLESNITPSAMKLMDDVANYSADMYDLLAVKNDGSLWSWELDWPDASIGYPSYDGPTHIMDNVVDVSNNGRTIMAIDSKGGLWSWGLNGYGQLGDGTTEDRYKPVKIMDDVVSVCNGGGYAMAVKSDGSLWGWGSNLYGQLANNDNKFNAEPVHIMDDIVYVSVFEDQYVMAVGNDDSVWFWGKESNINDDSFLSTPIRVDLGNLPDNDDEPDWLIEDSNSDSEIFGVEELDGEIFSYDTTAGFYEPLEYYSKFGGSYEGSTGQSSLWISIYSSQEEGETEIGNVWMYVDDEEYYLGMIIAEPEKDVYLVESDTGEEVVLDAYTNEGIIVIDLYVDGQYIDGYMMVEHYVP